MTLIVYQLFRHSEKPKITSVHDENDKVVEKIISAAIEGSVRSATVETVLKLDDTEWRLKSIHLKVPGSAKYAGQIYPH